MLRSFSLCLFILAIIPAVLFAEGNDDNPIIEAIQRLPKADITQEELQDLLKEIGQKLPTADRKQVEDATAHFENWLREVASADYEIMNSRDCESELIRIQLALRVARKSKRSAVPLEASGTNPTQDAHISEQLSRVRKPAPPQSHQEHKDDSNMPPNGYKRIRSVTVPANPAPDPKKSKPDAQRPEQEFQSLETKVDQGSLDALSSRSPVMDSFRDLQRQRSDLDAIGGPSGGSLLREKSGYEKQRDILKKELATLEAAEKKTVDKEGADKEGADKEGADKEGADKEGADKEAAEREAAEREAAEREAAEREAADKEAADKEAADKEAAEREAARRHSISHLKKEVEDLTLKIVACEKDIRSNRSQVAEVIDKLMVATADLPLTDSPSEDGFIVIKNLVRDDSAKSGSIPFRCELRSLNQEVKEISIAQPKVFKDSYKDERPKEADVVGTKLHLYETFTHEEKVSLPITLTLSVQSDARQDLRSSPSIIRHIRVPSIVYIVTADRIRKWKEEKDTRRLYKLYSAQHNGDPNGLAIVVEPYRLPSLANATDTEALIPMERLDRHFKNYNIDVYRGRLQVLEQLANDYSTAIARSRSGEPLQPSAVGPMSSRPRRMYFVDATEEQPAVPSSQKAGSEVDNQDDFLEFPGGEPDLRAKWAKIADRVKDPTLPNDRYRAMTLIDAYRQLTQLSVIALQESSLSPELEDEFRMRAEHFLERTIDQAIALMQQPRPSEEANLTGSKKQRHDDEVQFYHAAQRVARDALDDLFKKKSEWEEKSTRDEVMSGIGAIAKIENDVKVQGNILADSLARSLISGSWDYQTLVNRNFYIDEDKVDSAKSFDLFLCAYDEFFEQGCDLELCRKALEKSVELAGYEGLGLAEQYLALTYYRLGRIEEAQQMAWKGVVHEAIVEPEHLNFKKFGRERLAGDIRFWIESVRSSSKLKKIREIREQFVAEERARVERETYIKMLNLHAQQGGVIEDLAKLLRDRHERQIRELQSQQNLELNALRREILGPQTGSAPVP